MSDVYQPRSSGAAINLIVTEEDSGAAYYARHYTHFEWPQGASGPTVGIGYDCGYSTAEGIKADWTGFVSDQTVAALMRAAGIKGGASQSFVWRYGQSVTISWDQAIAQFKNHELKKWEDKLRADLPNADQLSGDSFGALTSLIYNRGDGGFDSPGARYGEMRAIKAHMAAKEFAKIPSEFLSMRRLWPVGGGLWNRRTHEAQLFSRGLASPALPA
jgi:GH24 family phage-related lysozyme (muramidase)